MPNSQKRDLRAAKARPSVLAPFGWAAILTSLLAGTIFFTRNLHSLPSHVGEFFMGILLLPAALVFDLLGRGDFLVWLSDFPEWGLFALMVLDAYFYSLVIMMLIWVMMRLVKRNNQNRTLSQAATLTRFQR